MYSVIFWNKTFLSSDKFLWFLKLCSHATPGITLAPTKVLWCPWVETQVPAHGVWGPTHHSSKPSSLFLWGDDDDDDTSTLNLANMPCESFYCFLITSTVSISQLPCQPQVSVAYTAGCWLLQHPVAIGIKVFCNTRAEQQCMQKLLDCMQQLLDCMQQTRQASKFWTLWSFELSGLDAETSLHSCSSPVFFNSIDSSSSHPPPAAVNHGRREVHRVPPRPPHPLHAASVMPPRSSWLIIVDQRQLQV